VNISVVFWFIVHFFGFYWSIANRPDMIGSYLLRPVFYLGQ